MTLNPEHSDLLARFDTTLGSFRSSRGLSWYDDYLATEVDAVVADLSTVYSDVATGPAYTPEGRLRDDPEMRSVWVKHPAVVLLTGEDEFPGEDTEDQFTSLDQGPNLNETRPVITSIVPDPTPTETDITITGDGFGFEQRTSTVTHHDGAILLTIVSWSMDTIVATIPVDTPLGTHEVQVQIGGQLSDPVNHQISIL